MTESAAGQFIACHFHSLEHLQPYVSRTKPKSTSITLVPQQDFSKSALQDMVTNNPKHWNKKKKKSTGKIKDPSIYHDAIHCLLESNLIL